MLARSGAPAYVAIDWYMEVMPAPDRYHAAAAIISSAARWLRSTIPRPMPLDEMPKCRSWATRFSNQVEDWAILTAEETLWSIKALVHTILTAGDQQYQVLTPAARRWNLWLPRADLLINSARELDHWRELPRLPKEEVKPKRGRKRLKAGKETQSLFSMVA
ncbi:hypothetical protein GobsT_37980 [Gemmata obscuriglobus]|nr:hypothetical protein GobsT_37980 [Gemmata obscuriglobus]VTS07593.1 unnamed protein product [Gemmata obscuriglobus UQM 2246]